MTEDELDYKALGFKAGLEIHQQLDAENRKLFCNCPSVLREEEPDYIVRRKLHAVAGESGKIDIAAAYQASLNKEFIYQGYDTNCLVELDESPPYEINKEALKIALHISILLNAKILQISQIMRKTVIDGSNTSGFQRTVLIAKDGWIETSKGKVGIEEIFLEEDSARLINKEKNKVTFRLDRLGIPLVEIKTSPDIFTPTQAKEAALKIGNILRSCKVKRGIGTIRQDVNMSINGGGRIEIKGFQDIRNIKKTIENEVKRQIKLVKSKKSINEVRNALSGRDGETAFLRPIPGEARMYPETDLPLLKISRDFINRAKKSLPKLRTEVEESLKKGGLNKEMIKLLFKRNKLEEFRELLKITEEPKLIAKILLLFPKEIASHKKIPEKKIEKTLNKDVFAFVLESLKKKKISESQIKKILERIVEGKSLEEAIVFEKKDVNIEEKIMKLIKSKPGLSLNAYMGLVMKNPEFRGKVSGKEAMEMIKKYIK